MTQEKDGASGWDRVARWAGIGNNKESKEVFGSGETMQDGTVGGGQEFRDLDRKLREQDAGETDGPRGASFRGQADGGIGNGEAVGDGAMDPHVLSTVEQELEQVQNERDQLKDRLARLQAEFDNARKREVKERTDTREYTIGSTIEPFLSVMDNFQLALKAEGTAEQLRGGVELILKQMEEALRGLQVQAIETIGAQFDPRIHEALGNIETVDQPDGQVLEEIRRGYKIREKLLRPALVRVAKNSAQVAE